MKMDKGAILASMAIIALASVLVGAGTMAYFNETAIVNPIFASGDPDIQIRVNDGDGWTDWTDGPVEVSTPVGWAPGDEDFTLTIRVKNVGTSGLLMLGVGGTTPRGNLKLADKIEITLLDATEFTDTDYMGCPMSYWEPIFGDGDGILTLSEFVASPYSARFFEDWPPLDTDYLDAGGGDVKEVKMMFHFMEDAGNEYQGLTYKFNLEITGTDDPTLLG